MSGVIAGEWLTSALKQKDEEIARLDQENARLRRENAELKRRMALAESDLERERCKYRSLTATLTNMVR